MNLKDTVEELARTAAGMQLTDLRRVVTDLRPDTGEVEPYVQFSADRYARNLVHRTDDFETLVLCWKPGQRSPLHDHANSLCSVYVYEGSMSTDNFQRTTSGHIRPDFSEDGKPGTVLSIQGKEIHQVSNLDETENLVSIHFYLAPLENYYIYSLTSRDFESYSPGYTRRFSFGSGI